jgi:hypothetical protein
VTSPGDREGAQPIDPDFAALFRPEDEAAVDGPSAERVPVEPAPEASVADSADDSAADASPPPVGPPVDTGRLFRSQGVDDHPEAVLALASDHFGRLRTLKRESDQPGRAAAVSVASVDEGAAHADAMVAGPTAPDDNSRTDAEEVAVYLIVIGVTVLVGFANALLADGTIGWPTGLALLVSSVYAALTVRREDDIIAFLTPPVAFFVAALTAGQVFIDSLEGSFLNRAVILFFTLAENWIWIIGSTLAALVIVLVRRRRS